jgi:hypothetical protein
MEYNLQETIYGKEYLLGKDVYVNGKHKILNVPLIDMMNEFGFIPKEKYNEIHDLSVVWYEDKFEDVVITQIYDHDSGEVYWDEHLISEEDWTDNDDELTNSLLMWGNLQETIGDYC